MNFIIDWRKPRWNSTEVAYKWKDLSSKKLTELNKLKNQINNSINKQTNKKVKENEKTHALFH